MLARNREKGMAGEWSFIILLPEEISEHYKKKKPARHGGNANRAVGLPTTISPSRNYSRRPKALEEGSLIRKTAKESEFPRFMGEEGSGVCHDQ